MLICAAACIIFLLIPKETPKTAVIYYDGSEICRRPLTEEGEFTLPELPQMTFEITDGGIRVISSDCPDKICIKQGLVKYESASAVCIPNKAAVTVEGDDND